MSSSCDWVQFLNLAKVLSEQGHTGPLPDAESKKRAAMSRAYYAVFHLANQHIRREDSKARLTEHGDTWRWFKHRPEKDMRQVGEDIDRLYGFRRMADYDDSISKLADCTWTSICLAESAIATIQSTVPRSSSVRDPST
jgi:uncharacterized protein (UPF0332 family)